MEKLKNKKLEVIPHYYRRGSKTNPNFPGVNKPSRIGPNTVLQSWLIYTVYHLLVKNNKVEGKGGFKEMVGLLTFFLWKWRGEGY